MGPIDSLGIDTVDAVTTLVEKGLYTQALTVLYSGIDTLAWVARAEGDVKPDDFIGWCEKYMRPSTTLGCTSKDLYGGRCGVVHSQSIDSRMSRNGDAHPIIYSHGPKAFARLLGLVSADPPASRRRVVDITALLAAFMGGVTDFADEVSADEKRRDAIVARAVHWLSWNAEPKPETAEERAELAAANARAEESLKAARFVEEHAARRAADPSYREAIPKEILDAFTRELGYPRD